MEPSNDDICSVTVQVWQNVFGREPLPGAPLSSPEALTVSGCVHITGGWEGTVSVATTEVLARSLTEEMFAMDPGEASDEELIDANGEMANMIGGNIKSLLPGPSQLSLPTVTRGSVMAFPGTDVAAEETFLIDGQPFQVVVRCRVSQPVPAHSGGAPS